MFLIRMFLVGMNFGRNVSARMFLVGHLPDDETDYVIHKVEVAKAFTEKRVSLLRRFVD